MKKSISLLFLLAFLLAGCGGGGISITSGYLTELKDLIWNASTRTLTFFLSCTSPPNVVITSMEGEYTGPTSGKFPLTYDPNTKLGQGIAQLPIDGEYTIKIYATDSSGKKTLVHQFSFTASSSGGGGGSGDDTPPPPPF